MRPEERARTVLSPAAWASRAWELYEAANAIHDPSAVNADAGISARLYSPELRRSWMFLVACACKALLRAALIAEERDELVRIYCDSKGKFPGFLLTNDLCTLVERLDIGLTRADRNLLGQLSLLLAEKESDQQHIGMPIRHQAMRQISCLMGVPETSLPADIDQARLFFLRLWAVVYRAVARTSYN